MRIDAEQGVGVYTGNVSVKLKDGSKTIKTIEQHNEGNANFFKYLLECVKGFSSLTHQPYKIHIYNEKGGQVIPFGVSATDMTNVTIANSVASMTINFLVPSMLINNKEIKSIKLFDITDTIEYAEVEFEYSITINTNVSLDIDWTLSIGNGPVGGNLNGKYRIK